MERCTADNTLHPVFRPKLIRLQGLLIDRTQFRLFETFRSPVRQNWLYHTTESTNALAWESAHQYGMAADFACKRNGIWSWNENEPWPMIEEAAKECGLLVPIAWDKGHVEDPLFRAIRRTFNAV